MNYISALPLSDLLSPELIAPRKTPILARIALTLRRRKEIAIGVAAAVFATIIIATLLQPVRYSATAMVMISSGQARIVSAEQSLTDDRENSAIVETAIEVLRSPYMARRLAAELKLQDDRRWISKRDAAKQENGAIDPELVKKVMRSISVHRRSVSDVIEITVKAPTAKQAAQMANALVGVYQVGREEMRGDTMKIADSWLSGRLAELRQEVRRKEAAIADYRAAHGLLNSGESSLSELQIGNIQASVLGADADLAEKIARYSQAASATRRNADDTLASALNSDTMRELRAREADLTRRQADLENRYTEAHPLVQSGRAEIDNLHQRIAAELKRISANAASEVDVAESRREALVKSLSSARGELITDNSALVDARELEREAAAARAVYESFLRRYQEIAEQSKLGFSDAMMISAAPEPKKPSSPKLMLALLMGLIVAGVFGAAAAFVVDHLLDSLDPAEELQQLLKLPIIASIPFVTPYARRLADPADRAVPDYFEAKPVTRFAEAYRMLRVRIEVATPAMTNRVVAVTSAGADEGKSTTALCLARAAAMAGKRAILVDCDLRNPTLAKVLGIAPRQGLREVLAGEAAWRDVVGADPRSGAHVIPAAESLDVPLSFEDAALKALVEELRKDYDLIVLNCAPVLIVAETVLIAPIADVTLLVAHWTNATRSAVATAAEHLKMSSVRGLRVVLNCVDGMDWNGRLGSASYYTPTRPQLPNYVERLFKDVASAPAVPTP